MATYSLDDGRTWAPYKTLLIFSDRGDIGKITANHLLVTKSGRWLLPFWQVRPQLMWRARSLLFCHVHSQRRAHSCSRRSMQEAHTSKDVGASCSGVLVSDDRGASWEPKGCVQRNDTWYVAAGIGSGWLYMTGDERSPILSRLQAD